MSYDPLKFYRETYGDLSSNATDFALKKPKVKIIRKKKRKQSVNVNLVKTRVENYQKRSCDRKIRYETETDAIETINERMKKGKSLTFYGCRFCEGFHLTTVRNELVK